MLAVKIISLSLQVMWALRRCCHTVRMKTLKLTIAALALVLLSGCSASMLYNQIARIAPWYVSEYVTLDEEQSARFRSELEQFLEWHRSEELSTYVVLLDNVELDLYSEVTADTMLRWESQFREAGERMQARVLDLAISTGEGLSDEQMTEFMTSMKERQSEMETDYLELSDEAFRESLAEESARRMKPFLGSLNNAQKQRLQLMASEMKRFDSVYLAQRQHYMAQMEDVLQRDEGWQQRARELVLSYESSELPEYRELNTHNRPIMYAAVADVLNMRTESQDRRLRKKLNGWRKQLVKMQEGRRW